MVKTLLDFSIPPLTFVMLASVGLALTGEDFARVRRQPGVVATGLIGPLVLLPAIAVGLVWLLEPAPEMAAALLLVAACPIGGISNAYSQFARASTALSVALTGLSCLLASVTIPALGHVFALVWGQTIDVRVPLTLLFGQLLVMLTLPVGLGVWVRRRWPVVARRYGPPLQRLSFIGIAIVLLLLLLDDPAGFLRSLVITAPLAAAFILCSGATGWAMGTVVSGDPRDRFTLAAEFATRNLGVAMAIAVTLLGRVEFARFAYTYFLVEIPLMVTAIRLFRQHQSRAALRVARTEPIV